MTTLELVEYYVDLLILQYKGKEKAEATIGAQTAPILMPQVSVQTISFSAVPDAGAFVLTYGEDDTTSLAYTDDSSAVQTALRALTDLDDVTVTGSFTDGFEVTFVGVLGVADLLVVSTNTLEASSVAVETTITETDLILPLAVEGAFNLLEDFNGPVAIGDQLDVLGSYVGVTRNGVGFNGQIINLTDSDFLSLIQIAISRNSGGSSLAEIQTFIQTWFEDKMLVFDYKNMTMSYLLSTAIGSEDLAQMIVTQNLLPVPMAVGLALIIYAPIITDFFGFRTYTIAAFNSTPFNDYTDYQTDWPWLSYSNALSS